MIVKMDDDDKVLIESIAAGGLNVAQETLSLVDRLRSAGMSRGQIRKTVDDAIQLAFRSPHNIPALPAGPVTVPVISLQ